MAIMFAIIGWTQTIVTIGTGTTSGSSGPIPGFYGFHNSAMLFTASEMTQGGIIQSFGLDIATAHADNTRSMKIYLKEVSDVSLASSQIMNNLLEGATLVYDSTNVNCSSTGWRMFNFSTPFIYSGTGNLLVITTGAACGTGGGCTVAVKYASTPTGKAWTKVIDNANINFATSTANTNTYRYNSRFSINDFPLDYCYPPSSLLASNIFHSSADLTWTARVSADSWTIEYKPSTSNTWLSETSTTNSFSLIGLTGSTTYNVRVKSNCSGSSTVSLWSNITFTTPTSCPAPTSLTVPSSSLTYSEALLTWKPTVNPATWDEGYLIQYKPSNIISWDSSISISSVLDTSYLLTGLLPSKTYNVRIKAVCNPGIDSSAWTSTTNFTTLLSCPAPTSLTVPSSNINFTEALLTWRPTKNPATWNEGYLIQYKPSTIISWDSSTSISSILDTSYLLTGLLPSKTYNVRIKAVCNPGTDSSAWTSSTSFNTLLSCPAPTSLVVPADKIRNNKALLTWKPTVNPYTWNEGYLIQYKPSTITDWALATTVSSIQDTSYLLQNLTASTTYNVRMRAVCNPGTDSSAWTSIATFKTDCDPSNIFPWVEGFESIAAINTLPACWSASSLGTNTCTQIVDYTSYNRKARTGTRAAWFKYGCNDKFTTPTFELTADNNYVFTFWYVTDGLSGWQKLQARVRGIDDNSINEIIGTPVINATNSVYTQYVGIYTPTVSGQYKFDIECQANSTPYYLTIDDIAIKENSCRAPSNVVVSNITTTGANLSWDLGSSSQWIVEYKASADLTWTRNTISTNSYTFTNLLPSKTYDIRLASLCGTDTSFVVSKTINTLCEIVTVFPWSEGFEESFISAVSPGNKPAPRCWTIIDRGGEYSTYQYWWTRSDGATNARTGTGSAQCYTDYGTTNHNDWLISPEIALTGNELLSFYVRRASSTTGEPEEISIYISSPDLTLDTLGMGTYDVLPGFTRIFHQDIPTGNWQKIEVNLTQYIGNRYIAFVREGTPDGYYLRLDDILIESPSCMNPTLLPTANITTNSAKISWFSAPTHNSWWLYYKTSTDVDYDSINITAPSPYIIQGLASATTYNYYLKAECGSEMSNPSNILTFTTQCDPIMVMPYSENFDNYGTGTAIMPECWVRTSTSGAYPYVTTGGYVTNYLYFYAGTIGTYNIAVMKPIDASIPINTLMATFHYKNSSTSDKFIVGVMTDPFDASTFDTVEIITGTSTWTQYEVNLNTYTGTGHLLAFKVPYTTTTGYGYLDELTIDYIPACARPAAISVNGLGLSMSVTLAPGNLTDTAWYIYYKPSTATIWDSVYTTTATTTINNLLLQTTYNIFARTVCDGGINSSPTQTKTYKTPCYDGAISIFPWTEGFETGLDCWPQEYTVGTANWSTSSSNTAPHTGSGYASFYNTARVNKTKLVSPELDLTVLSNPYVSFWHTQKAWASDQDELKVLYRTSPTASWTELVHYTTSIEFYQLDSIALPSGSPTYQIAFEGYGDYGYGIGLDDIKVYETTLPPTNILVTPSITTAQLTWTSGSTETAWQIRQGLTGTAIDVTVASYQANGLTPSTNYTYYVRGNYGAGKYSLWTPVTFRSLAIPQRVTTIAATSIGQNTATLHGTIIVGSEPIIDQGFVWRQIGANDTTWLESTATLTAGAISLDITSLLANANYEFRAYATTQSATIYGRISTFLTLPAPPAALTSPATSVAQTIATLNGVITEGSQLLTEKGFDWRLVGASTWTTIISTQNVDAITYNLTGLTASTNYEYRAYAKTATESAYGVVQSFTTLDIVPPVVLTTPATAITQTIATINASVTLGSEPITAQGFDWRLEGQSAWTRVASILVGGTMANNLTGLTASTNYEYRAFTTTASGSIYGNIQNFTTLAIVPPTPITGDAIAVEQTIEILNGSITLGSELITDQGFEWRLLGQTLWTPTSVALINNAMIHNLTGLTANTHYEFRAYATTISGIAYGETKSFRTLAMQPPVVTTDLPTSIVQTSATLNGTAIEIMAPILSQGFEWRELGQSTWTTILTALVDGVMTHNLTGLTPYTDYQYRAFANTDEGAVYGQTLNFKTLAIPPIVLTAPATSITQVIATLNGTITAGSEAITSQGIEWRKTGVTAWTTIPLVGTTLTHNLTGLTANTNYEYRVYAIIASGTVYGITQHFTTLAIVPPTVVTLAATSVAQTIATINGTIALGSETIISQGFEWKLASATAWTITTETMTSNAIIHSLTGLTPNRAYEFRAYAITESGTTYGNIQTLTTLVVPPTVVTNSATQITETTATLNGITTSGSEIIISQGFEWKLSSASTWANIETPLTGNATSYTLTGLTPNTDYEFRAYATTQSGNVYGQTQDFTTLAVPTLIATSMASQITQTAATLNAVLVIGSEPITSQGFEWKLLGANTWTTVTSTITGFEVMHNLTGLTAYTTYEYRVYATTASGNLYGEVRSFTTLPILQTVVTNNPTSITQNNAILNGTITAGSEVITSQGLEWKVANNASLSVEVAMVGNTVSYTLNGLSPNTAYEYRAYAKTASGTIKGDYVTFTTLAIVPPTVITSAVAAITQTTATLNGTITLGSGTIQVQGFEWRKTNTTTWTPLTVTLTGNAITHNLIGLTPNTAYECRAYATTAQGTVYGTTQTFTTLAIVPPTVATTAATQVAQTIATLNGTITLGSGIIQVQGFEWRKTNTTTWTPITVTLAGNAITHNLTNLTANTAYEYRAYATTAQGTVYGTIKTFTTLANVPAVAVTNAATAITQHTATLNGTITQGSEQISTQGFAYKQANTNDPIIITETLNGSAITHNLTGLAPNTAYEYVAFAITESDVIYGQSKTFTTLAITPTTVQTNAATGITENKATLNGSIAVGTEAIMTQGFEWRIANTNIWTPIIAIGTTLTHNLIGLTPNTTYEFRAYATASSGYTTYGAIHTFTTLAILPPTVITNAATPISGRAANLSGTITLGSEIITATGFEWKEAGTNEWTIIAATLSGSAITHTLNGLSPNQSYRFRAFATTATGTTYGSTQNFTTLGLYGTEGQDISIKMYPNPARIQTKLVVSGISGDVKIILSDVQGRILNTINTKVSGGELEQTIDLNNLVEGVYYIRIQNSDINKTQKLIVK